MATWLLQMPENDNQSSQIRITSDLSVLEIQAKTYRFCLCGEPSDNILMSSSSTALNLKMVNVSHAIPLILKWVLEY
jgi:hypothetical protein